MKKLHSKKMAFYLPLILKGMIPRFFLQRRLALELSGYGKYDPDLINERVDYYCKLDKNFNFPQETKKYRDLSIRRLPSGPCLNLKEYIRYFPKRLNFDFNINDLTRVPEQPSFVKSRPIGDHNTNSILMKLDSGRYFNVQKDILDFREKKSIAVFRGACHKTHRQEFIRQTYNIPKTDIGDTRKSEVGEPYYKSFMSLNEQLRSKFIISVEGKDVASGLAWVMASNSLCFMRKPRFEIWLMQGKLIPNQHYVLLRDDYSDLEQKIDYYTRNTDEALKIIANAQKHVAQFFDHKREKLISLLVLKKYFDLSGQM